MSSKKENKSYKVIMNKWKSPSNLEKRGIESFCKALSEAEKKRDL
jgi:hypothetical protein